MGPIQIYQKRYNPKKDILEMSSNSILMYYRRIKDRNHKLSFWKIGSGIDWLSQTSSLKKF